MTQTSLLRPLLAIGAAKSGLAAVALLVVVLSPARGELAFDSTIIILQGLWWFAAGCWLLLGSRSDRRAFFLGAFFLLAAGNFGGSLHVAADVAKGPWSTIFRIAGYLPVEIFCALALWLFALDFPSTPISFTAKRAFRRAIEISTGVGLLVLAASLPAILGQLAVLPASSLVVLVSEEILDPLRDSLLIPLTAAALAALAWKAAKSGGDERRRGKVFYLGILAAGGTATFSMICELAVQKIEPSFDLKQFYIDHGLYAAYMIFNHLLLASIPVTTAYAALVDKVLDVKLIARRALQYALARTTAILIIATPLAFFASYLYQQRDERVADLVAGPRFLLLLSILALGALSFRYRQVILDAVDRRFFREQFDAKFTLGWLMDQLRGVKSPAELSSLVTGGIDRALHLERISLLIDDGKLGKLVDPKGAMRALDHGSRLAGLLIGQQDPLEIDLDSESSPHHSLPEAERHWLVDGRVQMLSPSFGYDGGLIGILALGAKKSGLPFLHEDQQLVAAVSASTGLAIELLSLKHPQGIGRELGEELQGMECLGCGRVYPPSKSECGRCHVPLEKCLAPFILRNKYRFEERIGSGGMAVVYRATDLTLGRTVAIKTLPRVSPEAAMRLRREAITAASVDHPGLAAIFGFETWEGTPMLVLELLADGTLADRLALQGGLGAEEVVDIGLSVALALDRIHSVGILHRDVKPSNIGFNRGAAKLLDFGIAKIKADLRRQRAHPPSDTEPGGEQPTESWQGSDFTFSATGQIAGTLSYLSPEALEREEATPGFDLWSLSVVLYEAVTGENLFFGPNLHEVIESIRNARVPDVRTRAHSCPEPLALFLRRALDRDESKRPQSGREFHQELRQVRRRISER